MANKRSTSLQSLARRTWLLLLLGLALGCGGTPTADEDSTSLAYFARELSRTSHPYNNRKWARYHQQQRRTDADRRYEHWLATGIEQLRAGATPEAIATLDSLWDTLRVRDRGYEAGLRRQTQQYLALAGLRLGEQQNCIHHHAAGSCILPIEPAAVHRQRAGSERAVTHYRALLRADPQDYEARYLLNLAHQTLGQYPAALDTALLIRSPLFTAPARRWVRDVAVAQGLAAMGLAGGVIAEDFDRDGDPDLVVSAWDMQTQLRFFRNDGPGAWTEQPAAFGPGGVPGGLNLVQTDYNNDGWPDIFLLRGGWLGRYGHLPNTLLRNDGLAADGQLVFTDVTQAVGLTGRYPTQTAVWADFDNDGWLDVYIGNESAVAGRVNPCELYLNEGGTHFREVAHRAGVDLATLPQAAYIVKGVIAADYDNDGWVDLYISTRDDRNFLWRNTGPDADGIPHFEDATAASGLEGIYKTFTCWFWDYDNDGNEDLLAAGFHTPDFYEGRSISHNFAQELLGLEHGAQTGLLFRNRGDGTFADVSAAVGLDKILYMMGGNYGDIDHDGWLDFYCGNGDPDLRAVIPNRMFRFDGQRFEEITNGGFGHIQKGHGTVFADFDGDGDQDIYSVVGGFYQGDVYPNILLDNRTDNGNHAVRIRLRGQRSNRYGVGSRLRFVLCAGASRRTIYRTVGSGGSFGAASFTQSVGLGDAERIDTLEIRWAGSGTRQILTDLPADRLHEITEPPSRNQQPN